MVARRGAGPGGTSLIAWLVVSLLLTGACSLIYQQLWLRLLSLVFGVTVQAAATAIAAFMAGLALGGHLAGRLADRTRRPIAWYGASEVGAGVAALATSGALALTERAYVAIGGSIGGGSATLNVIRLVLSLAVLTIPATVMGASTPLVLTAASRSGPIGDRTALLYSVNTAGAIIGTLLAGFVLVGEFGIEASFRGAALVNIAVGAATLVASFAFFERRDGARVVASPATSPPLGADATTCEDPPAQVVTAPAPERVRRTVLWVFAVSGFASLALEIVWFRVLVLYVESTTYAFSAMLAVVLLGSGRPSSSPR